jgi:hypothetical protein
LGLFLAAFNDSPSIVECLRAEQAAANDDGQAFLHSGETLKGGRPRTTLEQNRF